MPIEPVWDNPRSTKEFYHRFPTMLGDFIAEAIQRENLDAEVKELEQSVLLLLMKEPHTIFNAYFGGHVADADRERLWRQWMKDKINVETLHSYREIQNAGTLRLNWSA